MQPPRTWWRATAAVRRQLAVAVAALAPCLSASEAQVMAYHGRAAEAAVHVLVAIAAGDAATVTDTDAATWHADAAIPDPADADRGLRWTRCIPAALARCPAEARARVLAAIDAAFEREREREPLLPEGHIADYLPSPRATALLRLRSAAAMDRGAWLAALAAGRLIDPTVLGPRGAARLDVAAQESGLGAAIDPALALPPPGEPVPATALTPPPAQGLSVRWTCVPGWILASRLGRVDWQYRVALDAEIVPGAGGTLVRDADGLRLIDEDGAVRSFPSPPGETRLLAVAGGAGWFAVGGRVWRLPLAGGAPQVIDLAAPPEGPPLVRGAQSLWLLPDRLVLAQDHAIVATIRHHLGVDARWRLCLADAVTPALVAPDGSTWQVPPLAQQLRTAAPLDQARLLLASDQPAAALARLSPPLDGAARAVAVACHVALGPAHVAADAPEIAALSDDPAARIGVWLVAWRTSEGTAHATATAHLQTALEDGRDAWVAWTPGDLGQPPEAWWHASTGTLLATALEARAHPRPPPVDLSAPLRPLVLKGEPMPRAQRLSEGDDPHLGHVHRDGATLYTLAHALGVTSVACYADTGGRTQVPQWRMRWPSERQVPSRSLVIADDAIVVAEGLSDLVILAPATGAMTAHVVVSDFSADPSRTCVSGGIIAMPGPLDDHLGLAITTPADGLDGALPAPVRMATIDLPARLRWMVPLPDGTGVLALLADGSVRHYPGGARVPVPPMVAAAAQAPESSSDGLVVFRAETTEAWGWRHLGDPAPERDGSGR